MAGPAGDTARSGLLHLLGSLYDGLPVGVVLATPEHELVYANREFFAITECTETDLATMGLTDVLSIFFPGAGPDFPSDPFPSAGRWQNMDKPIRRRDGTSAWVRAHLSTVKPWDGPEEFHQLLVEDITRYRELIDSLLNRHKLYRSIVERRPDPICRFLPNWSIIFANSSWCRSFGRSRRHVLGEDFLLLMPPADRRMFIEAVEEITPDTPAAELEQQLAWDEDRPLWLRWTVQATFYTTGHIKDYQAVGVDITDQKLAEERYIHADRLVSLGTLVSGVAHEVNNPNNFIMLNAPLALDLWNRIAPLLRERALSGGTGATDQELENILRDMPQLLGGVVEGAGRIRDIVQELKEFARRDDTRNFMPLSVNDVVASAVLLLGKTIRSATDRFCVRYGHELPVVRGRRQRLEQVVVNLLQNACHSLGDPGQAIEVETRRDGPCVAITIRDEGRGIPEGDLPRVTEPFFSTRNAEGGTGLGLSITAKIVQEHGGRLRLKSCPGGTTADVTLPAWME